MKKIIILLVALAIIRAECSFAEDFTIGVIPDWQKLTYQGTDGAQQMKNIAQWFVDHKKELNIVFVASLGDMTQGTFNATNYSAAQWRRNKEALGILRSNGIPFSPCQGNHDPYIAINKYFPVSYFENEPYWGGSMNGKIENAYYKFEAAGMKFLLLTTQWEKSKAVNQWADTILEANSDHRVIFVSHSGLSQVSNNTYLVDTIVRKHDNIFLGVMGHLCETDGEENWTTTSTGGKTQRLIRTDYQCRYVNGEPAAIIRYYAFKPNEDRVCAYTYDLRAHSWLTNETSQFSFHYDMETAGKQRSGPNPKL